jgi:HEAT repeat protein
MNFVQMLDHLINDSHFEPALYYNLSGLEAGELERLIEIWPSIPEERRGMLVQALVEIAEANFEMDFEAIFRWGLLDDDPVVRIASVEGLWEQEDLKLMRQLLQLLMSDSAQEVRAAAAQSLGRFILLGELGKLSAEQYQPVYETLRDLVFDPDESPEVQRRALEAISYAGGDEVVTLLQDAYEHPDEKMRVSAVFGMGRSADERWIEIVMGELFSVNPEMRYEAARACGELEARVAVPRLAELIDDPDREVQEATLWALGQTGGERARRLLQRCQDHGDEFVRHVAEVALQHLELMFGQLDMPFYSLADAEPDA